MTPDWNIFSFEKLQVLCPAKGFETLTHGSPALSLYQHSQDGDLSYIHHMSEAEHKDQASLQSE